jgi:hypothetical protein
MKGTKMKSNRLRRHPRMFFGLAPLLWAAAWFFYHRASREIHPQDPDVAKVNARRQHYADLLNRLHWPRP